MCTPRAAQPCPRLVSCAVRPVLCVVACAPCADCLHVLVAAVRPVDSPVYSSPIRSGRRTVRRTVVAVLPSAVAGPGAPDYYSCAVIGRAKAGLFCWRGVHTCSAMASGADVGTCFVVVRLPSTSSTTHRSACNRPHATSTPTPTLLPVRPWLCTGRWQWRSCRR